MLRHCELNNQENSRRSFEALDLNIELSIIGKGPNNKAGFFLNIFLKDEYVHQRIN